MAADVVTPFDRGLKPERKPFRAEERHKRRRKWYIAERMGRARTPDDKLSAALDFFRAVATDHRVDPVEVAKQTDHVTHILIAAADQIAKTVRRTR